MSSAEQGNGKQLYTHCPALRVPFDHPTTQDVCSSPTACARRMTDPSYRVPGNRLAAIEERVRQYLIQAAKNADPDHPFKATITYGDLCGAIDPEQQYWAWPRFRGIGKVLGRISTFEHEEGRPMLSTLVVQAGTLHTGPGFAGLGRELGYQIQQGQERAFWRSQVEAVVRYWTAAEETPTLTPTERALAMLASISEQLQEVQRLLSAA